MFGWIIHEARKAFRESAETFPPDHKALLKVPKGGSCCANCRFVNVKEHSCGSPHYARWNGGSHKLPNLPLDEMCSDWYEKGRR